MRIGLDARILTYSHYTGLKTYAQNLIWHLAKIDQENHYTLISPQKIDIPQAKNFNLLLARNFSPKFKRIVYEQLILPRVASRKKLELLHCLENVGPIFCPIPLVITLHDLRFFQKEYQQAKKPLRFKVNDEYQRQLIPFLLKKATIISPSKSTANLVKKINQNSWVKTIYHGLNPYWQVLKNIKKEPFFLFITDYSPTKNKDRVIKAFQDFVRLSPDYQLVIIASDQLGLTKARKAIVQLNLQSNTKILFQPSNKKLRFLYNQAQALLIPSILEGFGLPLLEAMACGCPVIASKRTSLPEIGGKAALYANPYSTREIVGKMKLIVQKPLLRKNLITKGLKNSQRFSWEKAAQETLDLYRQVVKK